MTDWHIETTSTPAPLLTEREAAKWLRVSVRTLQRLRRSGAIPCSYVGKLPRYSYDQLLNATSSPTPSPEPPPSAAQVFPSLAAPEPSASR